MKTTQYRSLAQLVDHTKGKRFAEAKSLAEDEYSILCDWIDYVEHRKEKPRKIDPQLSVYHYDLQTLLAVMDGMPSQATKYTQRLIEKGLAQWGSNTKRDHLP